VPENGSIMPTFSGAGWAIAGRISIVAVVAPASIARRETSPILIPLLYKPFGY
jgi:hypothetical protein